MIFYKCTYNLISAKPTVKTYTYKSEYDFETGEDVAVPKVKNGNGLVLVKVVDETEDLGKFSEDQITEISYGVKLEELD
jgi:hypothetical protein